jgi:hypothetical protein
MDDRQLKQQYLCTHIVEAGYNTQAFAQYMNSLKCKQQKYSHSQACLVDGTNIDNWSLDGIKEVVADFI